MSVRKGRTLDPEKVYAFARKYILFVNRIFRMDIEVEELKRSIPIKPTLYAKPSNNADILVCFELSNSPYYSFQNLIKSRHTGKGLMNLLDCSFLDKDDMRDKFRMMQGS